MKTQTLLLRYYKRRFYHGRSFIARAVDFLALRVITLAACYLWFTTLIDNTVMAAVLSLTALATISVAVELFKSLRLERFIQKAAEAYFRAPVSRTAFDSAEGRIPRRCKGLSRRQAFPVCG